MNQPLSSDYIYNHAESSSSVNFHDGEAEAPNFPSGNQLDDHNFDSLFSSQSRFESPSPTPESESPADGGLAPACSMETVHFPPEVSPAYGIWLQALSPTPATFASREIPMAPPEFSENDDPMSFPPSSSMLTTEQQLATLNKKLFFFTNAEEGEDPLDHYTSVIRAEDLTGIMETVPEESPPSVEREDF